MEEVSDERMVEVMLYCRGYNRTVVSEIFLGHF